MAGPVKRRTRRASPHPVGPLELSGALTIREADALHARLAGMLGAQPDWTVGCSEATDVDLCFVQLLIAARRAAAARGTRLTVTGPPGAALTAALARGGFLNADGRPTGADAAWLIGMDTP